MVPANWVRVSAMSTVALAVMATSVPAGSAQAGRDTRGSIRAMARPLSATVTSDLTFGRSDPSASTAIDSLIATDESLVLWANQFPSVLQSPGNDQGSIEDTLAGLELVEPLATSSPLYELDPATMAMEPSGFSLAASASATFLGLEEVGVAERFSAVPEPSVWILMLLGVPALLRTSYRRRRATRVGN